MTLLCNYFIVNTKATAVNKTSVILFWYVNRNNTIVKTIFYILLVS